MDKLLLFLIKTISLQPFVPISHRSNDDDNEGNDDDDDDDGNAMTSRAAAKAGDAERPEPRNSLGYSGKEPWLTVVKTLFNSSSLHD